MNIFRLLEQCHQSGVSVQVADDGIKLRGPAKAVRDSVALLRPHKAELIAALGAESGVTHEVWGDYTPYVCPAGISPELIAELSALIVKFGVVYGVTSDVLDRIRKAAMRQPVGTIADSVTYFKQTLK